VKRPALSLRARLVLAYVSSLIAAMLVFGAAAAVLVEREQYAAFDARLRATAAAAANLVDTTSGGIAVDKTDRRQLFDLATPQANILILDRNGKTVFSAGLPFVNQLPRAWLYGSGSLEARSGGESLRAWVMQLGAHHEGAAVVWSSTELIEETDRRIGVVFAATGLLLALVAAFVSAALTSRALDSALRRQQRFAADASHDLRAPLSVIRAEADLALRSPREPQLYQAALRSIAAEADTMERQVSGLLAAVRSTQEHRRKETIDLAALVRHVAVRLAPAARAKHVLIESPHDDEVARAKGDGEAVERALTAIVHNAIKHAPPGGQIVLTIGPSAKMVEVTVEDSGPGFSEAALAHGLDWFWSGQPSSDGSSGLGLAIADTIVRSNGGRITLTNSESGGARVSLTLPA